MSKIIGVTVGTPLSASSVANALKGKKSGEIVALTDVSPLEHEMKVKVSQGGVTLKKYGKNLFDASKLLKYKWSVDGNGVYSGTSGNLNYYFNRTSGVPYMTFEGVDRLTLSFWGYFKEGQSPNGLYFQFKYEDGTAESFSVKSTKDTYYTYTTKANAKPVALHFAYGNAGDMHYLRNIQIEVGTTATEYEPYVAPTTCPKADENGIVSGVTSLYPTTTLIPDTAGVTIEAEYNVDTKKYIDNKFAELQALILEV